MKYQMFFYCNCDFQTALTDGDELSILQCEHCFKLVSTEVTTLYSLECKACGHQEQLEDNVTFEESHRCKRCSLQGTIAYSDEDSIALFKINPNISAKEPCKKCKKNRFHDGGEKGFTCPKCRHQMLKQKMSDAWEEKKDEQQ